MFLLLLFIAASTDTQISCQDYSVNPVQDNLKRGARDAPYCSYRCSRIYQRSLNRMNENLESVQYIFERLEPAEDIRNACWKSFDFLDCMEHCELQNRQRLKVIRNVIEERCRNFVKGNETNLACISKYHTFIEVHCSSYMSEAIQHSKLKELGSMQQSCRYMYYHSMCLVNTVNSYCPNAVRLFTHSNLRDYFLSFLLPADDRQISDDLLDECQIYDFAKTFKAPFPPPKDSDAPVTVAASATTEKTAITHPDVQTSNTAINLVADTVSSAEESSTTAKTAFKKLFSPDEDLVDEPPNFFYSSLRSMSHGKKRPQEALEERSGSNDVEFTISSKSSEENIPERYLSETVDNKSLENTHKTVHVNIFDPETIVTSTGPVSTIPDDSAITRTRPDTAFPTALVAAAAIPIPSLLHVFPLATNTAATASGTTASPTAAHSKPTAATAVDTSFPVTDFLTEPEVTKPAKENYTIRRPTMLKAAASNKETAKMLPKTNANDMEHVKTLPTDSTGDEYFLHLIQQNQMVKLIPSKSAGKDGLNLETVKISRPGDGITIEITSSGEVIYVHDSDQQAGNQDNATETTEMFTATTASTDSENTVTGTATTHLPPTSKIQTTVVVPQQINYSPVPSSPAVSSHVRADYADLLEEIDIQPNVPGLIDDDDTSSGHSTTAVPRYLEPRVSHPPPSMTSTAKATTVYKLFQSVPKTKIYKIFPLPTITAYPTRQIVISESAGPQATLDSVIVSSKEVPYETNPLSTVIDNADVLNAIKPTGVHVKKIYIDPIKSFDEPGKVAHKAVDPLTETIKFETKQLSANAVFDENVTSADSAEPKMSRTRSYDLFFIYGVLVFVAFLAAFILLAGIALRS